MRKTSVFVLCSLFLAACGGSADVAICTFNYWNGTVGTCLPDQWHVIDRQELDERGIPEEVIVAFQADAPVSGQFVTVTVTREALSQPLDATEYSEASILSVQQLPGYDEIDQRSITIDEQSVNVHIYTAQPREDQPETRFFQASTVSGNVGFSFTGATPVSISSDIENQVVSILEGVTFVSPTEGEEE